MQGNRPHKVLNRHTDGSTQNGGIIGKPGYLVYSTWKDGAGVAVLREDGTGYIMTGWQADFTIV